MKSYDVIVIGGGIAGVAAGYALARRHHSVLLLEAEPQLAYHTTGRSAALYLESFGHLSIRLLTQSSRQTIANPPAELSDVSLFGIRRGALTIAESGQEEILRHRIDHAEAGNTKVYEIDTAEAHRLAPMINPDLVVGALWEPGATDVDVAGLHQMFVRGLRRHDAEIRTSSPVVGVDDAGGWTVHVGDEVIACGAVVDAAGAWGDHVAGMAGIDPVGLIPMRRTAFTVGGLPEWSELPIVEGALHDFYFKPDGAQLLCSPAEENPTEPGDPRPREEDIALAIERINGITSLGIRSVRSSWTGLRTFAPDRSMVIGEEPSAPGFYWLVGQGGTGIQTATAAGELVATMIGEEPIPESLTGLDLASLTPDRFRQESAPV